MSGILWLASYPKSGNTWMRVLLANLLAGRSVNINAVSLSENASSRELFDAAVGVESSELSLDEIETYRPHVFRRMAHDSPSRLYLKVHEAFCLTPYGDYLFPADVSLGALYIVRNPLDVAVSYAHHSGLSVDRTIDFLADDEARTGPMGEAASELLPQTLMSWSSHIETWVDQSSMPVHIVRYEDLSHAPLAVFKEAAAFSGIECSDEQVAGALERSSFAKLKSQELAGGFRERYLADRPFFREGRVGSWRKELSESQVQRIVERHSCVMQKLGYLTESFQLLV